jgi:hypothetical protein
VKVQLIQKENKEIAQNKFQRASPDIAMVIPTHSKGKLGDQRKQVNEEVIKYKKRWTLIQKI